MAILIGLSHFAIAQIHILLDMYKFSVFFFVSFLFPFSSILLISSFFLSFFLSLSICMIYLYKIPSMV